MEHQPDVRAGLIMTIGVSGALWIVVIVLSVQALTYHLQQGMYEQDVVAPPNQARQAYREAQLEQIQAYGWVDREAGIVTIPIDRAMSVYAGQQGQGGLQAEQAAQVETGP